MNGGTNGMKKRERTIQIRSQESKNGFRSGAEAYVVESIQQPAKKPEKKHNYEGK
jgi:hypothetical protein